MPKASKRSGRHGHVGNGYHEDYGATGRRLKRQDQLEKEDNLLPSLGRRTAST